MPLHLKSALVVLFLSTVALLLMRPLIAPLMLPGAYSPRRNIWLAITASAFLLPNVWLFFGVSALLLIWAARRDPNPAALYMLLVVILPPFSVYIPGMGLFNNLVQLSPQRVVTLVVLLPMAFKFLKSPEKPKPFKFALDWFAFAWVAYQVLVYMPHFPFTGTLRQVYNFSVDILIPYFVISRACTRVEQIRDMFVCFALSMLVFVPIAFAEVRLTTVLYSTVADQLNAPFAFGYLFRDGVMRAQLASGQAIVLGYQFAVAIALWLGVRKNVAQASWGWGALAALSCGLALSISRGPWVGAAAMALVFTLIGPGATARLTKLTVGAALALVVVLFTPYGDKVVSLLPFIGESDTGSITYRQQILDLTWVMVEQRPFFGSVLVRNELEELRQGQGIIDIVNVYAAFAMAFGLVGLSLFVACFLAALWKLALTVRASAGTAAQPLAAALTASLIGVMVILATVSNYLTIPNIYWALMGCSIALWSIVTKRTGVPIQVTRYAHRLAKTGMTR